ncbi:MAG TPA: DNA polymerase III subunit alpha [Caldithrix abyssi]|uniref:DNA polymerase III subunit alpha n=1 Tax=Caldithrix abyssi TaxID=187145 RepID=A0A7V4TZ91_CALAY|nr:DNA polymerase III subunit alpha [Caldithrix abyssi]
MKDFVHLHTHSYYSLLDGIPSPEELVLAAKKAGMKALALTDHNALYGAVEFYDKALECGIQPIIGAELTLNDGFNLLLLVKNDAGYRNLSHLITTGRLRGGHNKFVLYAKDFPGHTQGLIALSGGHKGKIYHLLKKRQSGEALREARRWQDMFGADFYLEMQRFDEQDMLINLRLRDLAAENSIPVAATNDVHFISPKEASLRKLMHAIAQKTVLEQVHTAGSPEQYLKNRRQMGELFSFLPQALDNTVRIARACTFAFRLGRPVFPTLPLPEGETGFSWLWKQCFSGAVKRYKPLTAEVTRRLEYELKIIHQLGFAEYFLIVKQIVDYCHERHIPCVGRGSAADSLVSYVLEITQVDPIRHKLYFERFLNPERSDPPDIDLDICWKNRDRVIDFVYQTFGRERTAMICTFNTFQDRSAIRDIARAYGLPEDEIGKITKYLPHHTRQSIEETINTLPELKELRYNASLYENILDQARRIADFPRHLSIHSGGIIIAPGRLSDYTPLEMAGKNIVIAQYDMYSIEKLGLVKMDLLGVRSLSIITDCLRAVKARHKNAAFRRDQDEERSEPASPERNQPLFNFLHKKETAISPLDLRSIPEDDPQVTAFIRSGRTMGCFQLESPAMRGLLQKMQIDNVDDVITAVALIRPGASGSGMKEIYIKRRAGLEKTTYIHPSLKPALEDTYGVIIYQEQVLQVAHFVAGLSLAQADTLRRAMTKARLKKEFMRIREAFLNGARKRGLNPQQAETVWSFLAQFVGYGFNKAHSATYGTIAYQTAYLKYYFPLDYMCAVLNNQGGFYGRMAYIEEARRMGITLLPPDIQRSQREFTCEGEAIRVGLQPVFELSERTIKAILQERARRPFSDLFDFIRRTRAGEKEVRHLIKAGALASLDDNAPRLLLLNDLFFKNNKKAETVRFIAGQTKLPPFNTYQKILNELEMLDFAVTAHPLSLFEERIPWENCVRSIDLARYANKRVLFCGWLVTSRRVAAASGGYMKFITLEDHFGLCEAVLFPALYNRYGHLLRSHGPYLVQGRVQSRLPGEANLIVDKLELVKLEKQEIEALLQRKEQDAGAVVSGY